MGIVKEHTDGSHVGVGGLSDDDLINKINPRRIIVYHVETLGIWCQNEKFYVGNDLTLLSFAKSKTTKILFYYQTKIIYLN